MSTHAVSNNGQEIVPATSPTSLSNMEDISTHNSSNDGQERASSSPPSPADMEDRSEEAENTQPSASASASRRKKSKKVVFGLTQDPQNQTSRPNAFKDDYVAQFPADPYGQETAPNARAWRVYVEEAAVFDENMVDQSRDGLDVMLVFAGLFSAVVTSFLVQVSQNLQADFSEMSALLLHDLLIVQLSVADGATVNVTTPSVDPAAKFEPDTIDVWINGLWVVSLVTSLVVALSAVLVKQWLHRYMTFPSGTPRLRSHIRQYRFMGLEKWRVRIIIGMLPIIMHISLMLFFAGLALFYIPLRASLTWAVGTITVLVCVLYLVSNTIPIIYPQCPYQTPLTDFIHHVCHVVPFGIHSIRHYCIVAYCGICKRLNPSQQQSFTAPESELGWQSNLKSLTQLESDAVQDTHATLSVDAFDWLYHMSSNPTVQTIVLQGISGLTAASCSYALTKWDHATDMQSQRLQLVREALQSPNFPSQPWLVERLCRACSFLPPGNGMAWLDVVCNTKSDDWDPCIKAALQIWLVHDWTILDDLKNIFISHSEVPMHPLIWERIIRYLLDQYQGVRPCTWFMYDKSALIQVLSLVISPPLATSPSVMLMTGPQVIWTLLQSQFWDSILKMEYLAPYDTVSSGHISSYNRTLIAAGKLALSLVQQYHCHDVDDSAQQQLKLLARVVRLIAGADVSWNTDYHRTVLDFFISVLEEIQDDSFRATIELEDDIRECLYCILPFYHGCSFTCSGFHFPALNCFLRTWAELYDCVQYDSVFTWDQSSDLEMPVEVLGFALYKGHEEAYRIVASRGWMWILFTEWVICGAKDKTTQFIECYINGLYAMRPDSNCREFCNDLHQPQQLILTLLLMTATNHPEPSAKSIGLLTKICPTHSSWSNCVETLKAILVWGQTPDPELSLFPWPPCLQSLADTKAFRKYPLVDWTARRFASINVQHNLDLMLQLLHEVLSNTENVDGVLMPDLENQPEHEPQRALDETSAPESEGLYVASGGN